MLLIGRNGSGKSTVRQALGVLQLIARGTNRVGTLVKPKDLARGRHEVPIRFELEVEIKGEIYGYSIAFEFPEGFKELRVLAETFEHKGSPIYTRDVAQVILSRSTQGQTNRSEFRIDWHLVALPIVQEMSASDPLSVFKRWLSRLLILRPVPSAIGGESTDETLEPLPDLTNFGAWFSGLLAFKPAAYVRIDSYLKQVMPDFHELRNPSTGKESRSLSITFAREQSEVTIPFQELSDGEKCFVVCALVLAANEAYGPLVCFWDEPDNYLAIDEVGHFVIALRKAFKQGGQLIATSHNAEAIRQFTSENTMLLYRNSHLEPTLVRRVADLQISGNLIDALIRGDVEP